MIDINKEAEEYAESSLLKRKAAKHFIAGYNSKATQAKVLQAQIEENNSILEMLKTHGNERCVFVVKDRIEELQQKLKQLENE
jgi:hypothetical protein